MRKTMYKAVLATVAAGLLSIGMATAETIDSSRYELLGNYPVTKISNKTRDEYDKERMIP